LTPDLTVGLIGVLAGGILNGSFVAPIKKNTQWRWENSWLVYSVSGLIVIPWLVAFGVVPNLGAIYHETSWATLFTVLAFGFGWGVGSVLFGLGIDRMGLAVGYGLILGLIAPIGTFLPLAVLHPERLWTRQGQALIVGTLIVLGGIFLCAKAGKLREGPQAKPLTGFGLALFICVLAGIFSPMLNFSFVFGDELQRKAAASGVDAGLAANAIWPLTLTAGFFTNTAYCFYLLHKNRSWSAFRAGGAGHWLWACLMGLLCFGSFLVYGVGATALGPLGGIVGWPLFMSMALITSNTLGALSGEWRGAPRQAWLYSLAGIGLLIIAITVIALGNPS
jgi:L-rhamnose-H+ transport protein